MSSRAAVAVLVDDTTDGGLDAWHENSAAADDVARVVQVGEPGGPTN